MIKNTLAVFVTFIGLVAVSHAAPFQNGGFETGPAVPGPFITLLNGDNGILGWTVLGAGGIDYIGTYWTPASGARSLDLSGNAGAPPSGVSQTFDTVTGHSYRVTFSLAGNPDASPVVKLLTVSAFPSGSSQNYTFDTTGRTTATMGWTSQNFNFVASGASTTISFLSTTGTAAGPALDNVAVADLTLSSVVPVPTLSHWGMILLAGTMGWIAFRRRWK